MTVLHKLLTAAALALGVILLGPYVNLHLFDTQPSTMPALSSGNEEQPVPVISSAARETRAEARNPGAPKPLSEIEKLLE